jgi:hypothetical protein
MLGVFRPWTILGHEWSVGQIQSVVAIVEQSDCEGHERPAAPSTRASFRAIMWFVLREGTPPLLSAGAGRGAI